MNHYWLWLILTGWLGWGAVYAHPPQIRDVSDFYAPLSQYGYWVHHPQYGWCWRPEDVDRDWRPYSVGRWIWTEHGWYWESPEPWAWACYHYGRWFWDDRHGWLWMPGTEWAPAWVEWRETETYVGWAPLPPTVHVITGPPVIIAPSAYVFVERRVFCEPDLPRWIIHHHWHHHTVIYRESRCVPPPCCGRNPCECPRRSSSCERPREERRRSCDEPRREQPRRTGETPAREVPVIRTSPAEPPAPRELPFVKHRRLETKPPAEIPTVRVAPTPVTEPVKIQVREPAGHRRWENRPQVYRPLVPSTFNDPQPSYAPSEERPSIPKIRHESPTPSRHPAESHPRLAHRFEAEKRLRERLQTKHDPPPSAPQPPVFSVAVVTEEPPEQPAIEVGITRHKSHRRLSAD
ncbi:MAG: hypothetical protein RMM51_07505 [Verrucomicrobiae bacterium]|nr:hypothetical protein [Verrucomicrobiae bacterium]